MDNPRTMDNGPLMASVDPTDSSVPIWHCDRLLEETKTLDIGLLRDDANLAAPWREP
uniref:Uncharacterized protein n=1 Tax=Solanum tuberosum TaxID=4113 RepID=M1DGH0_SOLTU